jgi:ribulose-phosphate 3-epimerase
MVEISASIVSCDLSRLGEEIKAVEANGADLIHIEVLDGCLMPNITLGFPIVGSVRKVTGLRIDVHLMILDPLRYVKHAVDAGGGRIIIPAEVYQDLNVGLHYIEKTGAQTGLSLNPSTNISTIKDSLRHVDVVLLLTNEPGLKENKLTNDVIKKIRDTRKIIDSMGVDTEIGVYGGVNKDNAKPIVDAGADILVCGKAIFRHPAGSVEALNEIRKSI